MHFGGAPFDYLGQDELNVTEFQLNEQRKAFREKEETLLARIKELEEQNARLQVSNNEMSVHISNSQSVELSRISIRSDISGSFSSGDWRECRCLLELLNEMRMAPERIHLKSGDDPDSQEGTSETRISFSQKAIQSFLSEYNTLINEKSRLFDLLNEIKRENNELLANKNRLEREKNDLLEFSNRLQSQNSLYSKNKAILRYKELKPDPEDEKNFYDCIVKADSCFSLLCPEKQERWQIEFKDWEEYKIKCEKEYMVISAIGNEDAGKSFVLSQTLGHSVPQGKFQTTVGICELFPHEKSQNQHCIALDTPGTNMAVEARRRMEELESYFEERRVSPTERLRKLYGDARIMESLLHEFVMKHAEILLVVVDQLAREDQNFLNSILERNKVAKKRILIVHNWKSCNEIHYMKGLIEKKIKETCLHPIEERFIGQKDEIIIHAYDESTPEGEITHLIMAHEGSPAGDVYNSFALEEIRKIITVTRDLKKFDLVRKFKEHLETHIENHLFTTMTNLGQEEIFSLQYNAEAAPSSLFLNNASTFDLKNNIVNEIGILKTFVQGRLETVPYVIKYLHRQGFLYAIQVEFEVCGNCRDLQVRSILKGDNGKNSLVITITAVSEDNGQQGGIVLENTRSFGRFRIVTGQLPLGDMIEDKPRGIQIVNGVAGLKTATIFLTPRRRGDSESFYWDP